MYLLLWSCLKGPPFKAGHKTAISGLPLVDGQFWQRAMGLPSYFFVVAHVLNVLFSLFIGAVKVPLVGMQNG